MLKRGGTAGSFWEASRPQRTRGFFVFSQPRGRPNMATGTYPTRDQAHELSRRGNLIPIYREVLADMETPVSVYRKIARGGFSFLLESVEGGERLARYSFIGTEPRLTVTLRDGDAV